MMPEANPVKQTTTYTFVYGGESESMDLNTLLLSQMHFSWIIGEIKNEIAKDSNLSIKIKPLEKGSIPFDFILDISLFDSLFTPLAVYTGIPAAIIGTWIGIVQLRKWSVGKKYTKITILDRGRIIVTVGERDFEVSEICYKLSQNPAIDKALAKGFEAIEKDESIDNIQVIDQEKKPVLSVARAEFVNFTATNENLEQKTQTETKEEQLTVLKVVFDKGYKWQFYDKMGRKVSANMEDEAFMDRINKGEAFSKGDTIVAEVEVEKVFDESVNMFIENNSKIIRVINHTPRPTPPKSTPLF